MKKNNNPELATFTLLNPDFHASVDQGASENNDEENIDNNEQRLPDSE